MKRALVAALSFAVVLGLGACSLVVGSLDECKADGDCASKGANLVCKDSLCVQGPVVVVDAGPDVLRDPLCQDVYGDATQPDLVRFGAVVSRSTNGEPDQRGVLREHAIQLAVEQLNAKNGLPGKTLVVRVCDDTGDTTKASAEAHEMLQEGEIAFITTGSAQTLAVADVALPAGAAVMSASATSAQIAAAGVLGDGGAKLVWSTAPSDVLQGRVLGDQILAGPGFGSTFSKPWCIQRDDIAFNGLYDAINAELRSATDGGLFLGRSIYQAGGNVAGAVADAMSNSPDAVVIIAPPAESTPIINAWTAADPKWFFTDNSRNNALTAGVNGGVARLAGSVGTGPSAPSPADPEYSYFKSAYISEFTIDPGSASYTPNAYDSVLLLSAGALWAQDHGGITGPAIAQGLTQLSDTTPLPDGGGPTSLRADNFTTLNAAFTQNQKVNVQGASGPLDFDPGTGTAPGAIDVWTIQPDGGISTVFTVAP